MKQYKELVQNILDNGQKRGDRTGTGTISVFGTQTRYDLQKGFPLLTTKKVNFRALVAELLWMLKGSTNIKDLDAKIWDEWADDDGELGPIYGHQWRNWGGTGIDQIQQAIDTIKSNPSSRRIIVNAWNVADVPKMSLPPCHLMFQFYVRIGDSPYTKGEGADFFLDCQMYQRSADVALGVPFNIASYALLMSMVALECGLEPGVLVHTIGDAHIYLNHVEGMKAQMEREPRELPRLRLNNKRGFDDMIPEDIILQNYDPAPPIRFEISV